MEEPNPVTPPPLLQPEPANEITKVSCIPNIMIFGSPKCTICNLSAEIRNEAEDMRLQRRSFDDIRKFLASKNVFLAISNISNHMNNHYTMQEAALCIQDYKDRIKNEKLKKIDTRDQLEELFHISQHELFRATAIPTDLDINKEATRSELVNKHTKTSLDILNSIKALENSDERVKVLQGQFVSIWKKKIDNSANENEKRYLMETFTQFVRAIKEESTGANGKELKP